MTPTEINPKGNRLGEGISIDDVRKAVRKSGYPLQTLVAAQLEDMFGIVEEWGYVDRKTDKQRTLDVFAYRRGTGAFSGNVAPLSVALLIECKKSSLPYIFFQTVTKHRLPEYPIIAGLHSLKLRNPTQRVTRSTNPAEALGLTESGFAREVPALCSSFSKAERKGKKLMLTGTQPYKNIVLPLISATEYAWRYYQPPSGQEKLFPVMLLGICVLDAPLVTVDVSSDEEEIKLHPWVRIRRQEARPSSSNSNSLRFYGVDVIHKDFLSIFVSDYLLPFAETVQNRIRQKSRFLEVGTGRVPKLNGWNWKEVQADR